MLSLQPAAAVATTLVLAIGNPSRGDDAIGPLVAERLQALSLHGVEVLTDFQLQVEHALDLCGRTGVIFVDAAATGAEPFALTPLAAAPELPHTSHSLSPAEVLQTCIQLTGATPPAAQLLAIRGYEFELGRPLSAQAMRNLEAALRCVVPLLRAPTR